MGQMSNRKARVSLPEPDFPAREEKIQQTIRAAEQSLLDAQAREPMGMGEFFVSQVRYVRKRWWLLQTLLLAALYWYVVNQTQAIFVRQALGTGGTILIVLAIPELWKNLGWGAMDVEFTSMYTIRQVYCVRLILFSGVDLMSITLFLSGSVGWRCPGDLGPDGAVYHAGQCDGVYLPDLLVLSEGKEPGVSAGAVSVLCRPLAKNGHG